jgi:syntaxin-binding protein 5
VIPKLWFFLPTCGVMGTSGTLILANPGQMHFYSDAGLTSLAGEKELCFFIRYSMIIPIMKPRITMAKLGLVFRDGKRETCVM